MSLSVDVVIPARDEASTIAEVVREVLRERVRSVVVVDNGSRDRTGEIARDAGARVLREERPGYGNACLAAMRELPRDGVMVFVVADGSDDPSELRRLVAPIAEGRADMVIGSRSLGHVEPGAMPPWQRAGSLFAAGVLSLRYGQRVTDLGPFRAIRRSSLDALEMRDPTYGWTLEMQIKASRMGLRVCEAPVTWRKRRGGEPKVSGTLRGTLGASRSILLWLNGALRGPSHDPH